jgi:hypothetical protein
MRRWIDIAEQAFGSTELLYHGTDFDALLTIWSGSAVDAMGWSDGPNGVSLTRSFDVARAFAKDKGESIENIYADLGIDADLPDGVMGCVFEFRRDKIPCEIIPFDDFEGFDYDDPENEERALGRVPLSAMTALYLDKGLFAQFREDIMSSKDAQDDFRQSIRFFDEILNHPLSQHREWK